VKKKSFLGLFPGNTGASECWAAQKTYINLGFFVRFDRQTVAGNPCREKNIGKNRFPARFPGHLNPITQTACDALPIKRDAAKPFWD